MAQPTQPAKPSAEAEAAAGGQIVWGELIAPDVLEDEIKQLVGRVAADVRGVGHFKADGFREARTDFTVLAACFGIIAQYPGDIRWEARIGWQLAIVHNSAPRGDATARPPPTPRFARPNRAAMIWPTSSGVDKSNCPRAKPRSLGTRCSTAAR